MKKMVFLFGRFQVPTKGHAEMIHYGLNLAKKTGAEFRLYTSQTQDSQKNPLPYKTKVMYLRMLFPGINVVHDKTAYNTFQICKKLSAEGYDDVTMVVGGDRVQEFQTKIGQYVKDRDEPDFDPKKHYAFKSFKVVNSGNRKIGVSGTDMRNHIRKGDFNKFLQNTPTTNKELARSIFRTTKGFLKEEMLEEARKFEPLKMRTASSGSIASHVKNRSILDHPSIRTPKAAKAAKAALRHDASMAVHRQKWRDAMKAKIKKIKQKGTRTLSAWEKRLYTPKKQPKKSSSHLASSPQMDSNTQFHPSWLNTGDSVWKKAWEKFQYPKTNHSNKIVTLPGRKNSYKIYKNPDADEFDKLIKNGALRILRANGDWYVWSWNAYVHYQVIDNLELAPDSMDMPHVNAAENRIPNGIPNYHLKL